MTDELVKFETAKLAKAKGFDEPCGNHWSFGNCDAHAGLYVAGFVDENYESRKYKNSELTDWGLPYGEFSAPTQSLLQRWLREKHDIHCVIEVGTRNGNNVFESNLRCDNFNDEEMDESESSEYTFDTYEKALEDCLIDALNYI